MPKLLKELWMIFLVITPAVFINSMSFWNNATGAFTLVESFQIQGHFPWELSMFTESVKAVIELESGPGKQSQVHHAERGMLSKDL